MPPMEYFKGIREICDEYGIVFVADEIAIGMGRTGKWWCIEHYGVTPDLITTSKSTFGRRVASFRGSWETGRSWKRGPAIPISIWERGMEARLAAKRRR